MKKFRVPSFVFFLCFPNVAEKGSRFKVGGSGGQEVTKVVAFASASIRKHPVHKQSRVSRTSTDPPTPPPPPLPPHPRQLRPPARVMR